MALAITLVLATVAGFAAWWAHLPLGFLLGSLLVTGGIAAIGWRPLGRPVTLPTPLRQCFVPIIGVAIGGAFTPAVLGQALGWLPSLLALCVFVPLAHGLGYFIYRRGGLSKVDALFGAIPGGLVGIRATGRGGGRGCAAADGVAVSAADPDDHYRADDLLGADGGPGRVGVRGADGGGDVPLGLHEVALLVAAGVVGVAVGRLLRLPGWIITGPIAVSGLVHGLGWVQAVPPGWRSR